MSKDKGSKEVKKAKAEGGSKKGSSDYQSGKSSKSSDDSGFSKKK